MAWFEQIRDSSSLFLYGGGAWVFFNNQGPCVSGWCQCNAIIVENAKDVYMYGSNTHNIANMAVGGLGSDLMVVTADENVGGWGGVIAGMIIA